MAASTFSKSKGNGAGGRASKKTKPAPPESSAVYGLPQLEVDSLLRTMVRAGDDVTELFFIAGQPPHFRSSGLLQPMPTDPPGCGLSVRRIEEMFLVMSGRDPRLAAEFEKTGCCDCSYDIRGIRFGIHYFRRDGLPSMVLRRLPTQIPSIASAGLPTILRQIAQETHGLVLVCGAVGQGKSTTLTALLGEVNENRCVHVVTLEDPIEYFYSGKQAIISQRELGKDFPNFPAGLRAAQRQAADIVAISDLRDRETLEMALLAAEKGRLVVACLTVANASQAIARLASWLGSEEEPRTRLRLANTLRWIVSQRLLPMIDGGQKVVMEILGQGPRTRSAILEGENEQRCLVDIIHSCQALGWQTFDQEIFIARQMGAISEETFQAHASPKTRISTQFETARRAPLFANSPDLSSGLRLNADPVRVTRIIR